MAESFTRDDSPPMDVGTDVLQLRHDDADPACICTRIVLAVGSRIGEEPTQMLPLHRSVDPDALEAHVGNRDRGAELTFEYYDYRVTVRDDGHVTAIPLE